LGGGRRAFILGEFIVIICIQCKGGGCEMGVLLFHFFLVKSYTYLCCTIESTVKTFIDIKNNLFIRIVVVV